jgi:hypothetical protein
MECLQIGSSKFIKDLGARGIPYCAKPPSDNRKLLQEKASDQHSNWLENLKQILNWKRAHTNLLLGPPRANTTVFRNKYLWINRITLLIATMVFSALTHAASTDWDPIANNCTEIADFGDELVLSEFSIINQTDAGNGLVDVQISAKLSNQDVGRFDSASAIPDFSTSGLNLAADVEVQDFQFGPLETLNSTMQSQALQVRLPVDEVSFLLGQLQSGAIPFKVRATETAVLKDNVVVRVWTQEAQDAWMGYMDFFGIPHDTSATLGVLNFESFFGDYQSNMDFFLTIDPNVFIPDVVPEELWNVRITGLVVEDQSPYVFYTAGYRKVDPQSDKVADLVHTGSFCTRAKHAIDEPVQASRLQDIDGSTPTDEQRDSHAQPIRFNNLDFDGILVSGQVTGHVLRPKLHIRVRDGKVKINSDFDSQLTIAASIIASASTSLPEEPIPLYHLCFPLGSFTIGPIHFYSNLTLDHDISLQANMQAGMEIGFNKTFQSTVSIGADLDLTNPYYEVSGQESLMEFTPPYLNTGASADAHLSTTLRAAFNLELFQTYPDCQNGFGTYIQARAGAQLTVDPFLQEWWQLQPTLKLSGGIGFDFFGISGATHDLLEVDILQDQTFQAPTSRQTLNLLAQSDVKQSGQDQRWVTITTKHADDIKSRGIAIDHVDVASTDDGLVAVAHSDNLITNDRLYKWDRFGAFQWVKHYQNAHNPQSVLPQIDGSLVVGGFRANTDTMWLARHDTDGNEQWSKRYNIIDPNTDEKCILRDMTNSVSEGGTSIIAVGYISRANIRQRDGCIVYFNSDGDVLWTKYYEHDDLLEFHAITTTDNGGFAIAGVTGFGPEHPVASARNPLIMTIDAHGNLEWAKSLPINNRAAMFNAVVQGHDGHLYMAGGGPGNIRLTGSLIVARIDQDGSDPRHAIVFQDENWEALLDFETWQDTDGGSTQFDTAYDLSALSDGIVLAGKTGLGQTTAAWAIKLNANLGVQWHTVYDGDGNDTFYSVSDTGDGLVLAGSTEALLKDGATSHSALMLMKLPYEGYIAFPENSLFLSRYVEPGVMSSFTDKDIVIADVAMDIALQTQDAKIVTTTAITDLLFPDGAYCVTLLTKTGHVSRNDACEHDSDGDGLSDAVEDSNGNYLVDSDETDPFNADTDGDDIDDSTDAFPLDPTESSDSDGDAKGDNSDNCTLQPNTLQRDTDQDGYGNSCDPDFDNNLIVNAADLAYLKSRFFTTDQTGIHADLTGDGIVNAADLAILKSFFFKPPGPSGIAP